MASEIKLPDTGGVTKAISREEARQRILAYCEGSVFALYDKTNEGPHDEVMPIDLLSLAALNAFAGSGSMTIMDGAWRRKDEIADKIKLIEKKDFTQLSPDVLETERQKVCSALDWLSRIKGWGGGGTRTAKLLHRLRPNIIPIWDDEVGRWYGGPRQSWQEFVAAVHRHVKDAEECLEGIQSDVECEFSSKVPLLRLWDMLLWKVGTQRD